MNQRKTEAELQACAARLRAMHEGTVCVAEIMEVNYYAHYKEMRPAQLQYRIIHLGLNANTGDVDSLEQAEAEIERMGSGASILERAEKLEREAAELRASLVKPEVAS